MFVKTTKLKKFGIFRDFLWDSNTPNFARLNLIYGWNKSGKTTFSRVFSACEKKTTDFIQYPKDKDGNLGEFEITTNRGTTIKHSDCQNCIKQIRVFNKDFIEDNVSFDPSSPSNPIVYVSEGDIESNKKLKELRGSVILLSQKFESAQKDEQKSEKAEDDFRISTARTIKDMIGNLKVNDKYRDYDKGSVKTAIEDVGIDRFTKLSDEDFEKKKKFISGKELKNQTKFTEYELGFLFNGKNPSNFLDVHNELTGLLKRQVVSETIDRFKDDPDLNKWAQHGFELHKTKDEKKKCLFCQNEFSESFFELLSKHFSNDYEKLLEDITLFIQGLVDLKMEEITEKNLELYADLQDRYKNESQKLNNIIKDMNDWIGDAIKKLNEKNDNPLSIITAPKPPKDFKSSYNKTVDEINTVITNHNVRVENYEQEVKIVKEELENHLIASAIVAQDYSKIKEDFNLSVKAKKEAKNAVDENNRQISNLEKEKSNIGKAVQKINKHLEEFFGRKEIQLELDDLKKGYIIKRDDDIARNLSESEKNAIALSYFIVKTRERGFKIKEAIIVIDDPVSSFDSNFIYHCFSLIKNYFKDAEQLIISTHNFEFFNLVKDWLEQKNRKVESNNKKIVKKADKKPIPCEFFMIENIVKNEKRCASIAPLEETLRKFKSEYHFLFSRLNQFIAKGSPDYADFYIIGNIARRFLEIYINFKIPTTGDLKSKVDQLDTQTVSETEKDKVYKLIQEFSHGLDPVSTIEHKDKSEIQDAIKVLMKMVKESDGKHFESLKSNL